MPGLIKLIMLLSVLGLVAGCAAVKTATQTRPQSYIRLKTPKKMHGKVDGGKRGYPITDPKTVEYLNKVYKKIRKNWKVPTLIPDRERLFLQAIIIVYLKPSGKIKKLRFEKKSGNANYDKACAKTVRKSAPFPPPPKELAKSYEQDGIGIPFSAGRR